MKFRNVRIRKPVRMGTVRAIGIGFALVVMFPALRAADGDTAYRMSVAKWRQTYEASLKSDDGWLTVSGLFWLHEGENRFGSDPLNDIVLPVASSPAQAGSFEFRDGKTAVHLNPGVKATLNGKPVESADLRPDLPTDRLHLGDLTLLVHASGARFGIRLKDKNSKLRKQFTGLRWFPVDEKYKLTARFVPYDPPKKIQIQNVLGDFDETDVVGYAVFSLDGQEYHLEAEPDAPGTVEFVFRDLTSGKETYPAARFLDAEAPHNGTVALDFNEAYNPPCAYNPYTTCPLPTPQNRLRVAIPAGEKMYGNGHAE
jgi:uncharacterized protein (DUF1684 family)